MTVAPLAVHDVSGMTCVGVEGRPHAVSFAFVGRTGGVSVGDFASLNVGDAVGDDEAAVAENRRRALTVIGAGGVTSAAVVAPHQVHGADVVCVNASDADTLAAAKRRATVGADAVVVSAAGVPALMAFADCVPVVLVAPHAFALVHSGWRGTLERVVAVAAATLGRVAGCGAGELWGYVGPHIACASYEVSPGLAARFSAEFGASVVADGRHLDLGAAVVRTLTDAGLDAAAVIDCGIDTATATDAWFSHRASGGRTGRHAAVAWIAPAVGERYGAARTAPRTRGEGA